MLSNYHFFQTNINKYAASPNSSLQNLESAKCPQGLSATQSRALFTCALSPNTEIVSIQPNSHSYQAIPLVGMNRVTCQLDRDRPKLDGLSRPKRVDNFDCMENSPGDSVCIYIMCNGECFSLSTVTILSTSLQERK